MNLLPSRIKPEHAPLEMLTQGWGLVSELVYLTSLLNSQGLMSDGPVAGQ